MAYARRQTQATEKPLLMNGSYVAYVLNKHEIYKWINEYWQVSQKFT